MSNKRRYAQVGVGARGAMYLEALATTFADTCELVAICDNNAGRLQQRTAWLHEQGAATQGYLAGDFERMIAECRPDAVIVTSIDASHDDYLCRAMELGCDVISEKPLTIDAARCRRILDTQRRTGRECKVTFNCRYQPGLMQVKDLLMSGVIGEVLSVDLHWMLDTVHGADYFRRWHRNKANSGGLLLHKATHHFDLVNWWLSAVPTSVYAVGRRNFYLPQTAERYGLTQRGEYCRDCAETARCPFYLDINAYDGLRTLYADHEQYDGYLRDRCPFSADIDIDDTMHLTVTYDTGVTMSYSLNAFLPVEGLTVAFNGSKGRLELLAVSPDAMIRIHPHHANHQVHEIPVWTADGTHGGSDPIMLQDIFAPNGQYDKYQRAADQRAGAYSILIGIAANESIAARQVVNIADLVPDLERPDYPPMPTSDAMLV